MCICLASLYTLCRLQRSVSYMKCVSSPPEADVSSGNMAPICSIGRFSESFFRRFSDAPTFRFAMRYALCSLHIEWHNDHLLMPVIYQSSL